MNDDQSRAFVSLYIRDYSNALARVVNTVDDVLRRFAQPAYYKHPVFHISVLSFVPTTKQQDDYRQQQQQQQRLQSSHHNPSNVIVTRSMLFESCNINHKTLNSTSVATTTAILPLPPPAIECSTVSINVKPRPCAMITTEELFADLESRCSQSNNSDDDDDEQEEEGNDVWQMAMKMFKHNASEAYSSSSSSCSSSSSVIDNHTKTIDSSFPSPTFLPSSLPTDCDVYPPSAALLSSSAQETQPPSPAEETQPPPTQPPPSAQETQPPSPAEITVVSVTFIDCSIGNKIYRIYLSGKQNEKNVTKSVELMSEVVGTDRLKRRKIV